MTEANFEGRAILVVEDEYIMAMDLEKLLQQAGAKVVGPVASVAGAFELLETGIAIDGAVLDINLNGERVYPLADQLLEHNIPVVFTTGYDEHDLPERFVHVPRLGKPIDPRVMVKKLSHALFES